MVVGDPLLPAALLASIGRMHQLKPLNPPSNASETIALTWRAFGSVAARYSSSVRSAQSLD